MLGYGHFDNGEWMQLVASSSNSRCARRPIMYSLFKFAELFAVSAIWVWSLTEHAIIGHCGGKMFIYLTIWSLTLQMLHTWLAWYLTLKVADIEARELTNQYLEMPWYARLSWILQDILVPLTFLVSALFFALVMDWADPPTTALPYFEHGLNFAIMLVDVFFSRQPFYLLHSVYFIIFAAVYIVFTLLYHAASATNCDGDPFIYNAIDWRSASSTASLVLTLLFVVVPMVNIAFWLLIGGCFPNRMQSGPAEGVEEKDSQVVGEAGQAAAEEPSIV